MSNEKQPGISQIGDLKGIPVYYDPSMDRETILVGRKQGAEGPQYIITGIPLDEFPFDEESKKKFFEIQLGKKLGIL